MPTPMSAVNDLARRGFKVFPIAAGLKAPPLVRNWPQVASSDHGQYSIDFAVGPADANIGIHCAGFLVIDVDVKKDGDESLVFLQIQHDDLPPTLTTRTPSGGRHLFYRLPEGHPGVKNGVDVLGKGLDIRSTNGYVVAPGSRVPAGEYRFENPEQPIADAPEWLVHLCGVYTPRERTGIVNVPDAPESVVATATEWLRIADRSVKGAGGDETAYKVACRLRDFGLSYEQACDAMRSEAWSYGCGWRDGRLEEKPIRSAYRYATGEAGSKGVVPEMFDIVENPTPDIENTTPARKPRPGPQRLLDFASEEYRGPGYLVKGLLNRESYALEYGSPGAGKTFVALDIAYSVAAGLEWMDHRVHQGPVLYLAYEGAGGMRKRAKALRQRYGNDDVPLYMMAADFNLREKTGRQELGAVIATLPAKPVLIVIDTFAHALCGGDENSAQDVGAFNAGVQALIEHTKACVLVLHHPGKAGNGARGSSALLGAVDTEFEVADRQVRATKQRDIEIGDPIPFKLMPVTVGIDEDGEQETSCYIEESASAPDMASVRKLKEGTLPRMMFDILAELRPTNEPITDTEWKQALEEVAPGRQAWYAAKVRLKRMKLIVEENDMYRRVLE